MTTITAPETSTTIECKICGASVHHIGKHLTDAAHPGVATADEYRARFPGAPLTSPAFDAAQAKHAARAEAEKAAEAAMLARVMPAQTHGTTERKAMHEIFGVALDQHTRSTPTAGQRNGNPIMLEVLTGHGASDLETIPALDNEYIFPGAELKDFVMGVVLGDNVFVYGPHGTGKTTFVEQVCARLGRPCLRVQHTDTTEESHIVGQMVVRDGATVFDYGPLAEAMLNGWSYLADEYDVAHAGVLAVYQPVLEGKDLYIKEAPPAQRRVKPHPNFRFFATGNTNGSGDDTGLYSGTKVGNAANYSRFGTTLRIGYPPEAQERSMLMKRTLIDDSEAKKMVDFASRVRAMYEAGECSLPISPRELLGAGRKAVATGGRFRHALDLNFINRLGKIEGEAVRQAAQRVFG